MTTRKKLYSKFIASALALVVTLTAFSGCKVNNVPFNSIDSGNNGTDGAVQPENSAENAAEKDTYPVEKLQEVSQIKELPGYIAQMDKNSIMSIEISADETEWQNMLDNASREEYIPADITINGETIKNAGIRPKGNSSLSSIARDSTTDRYSFKIEFDHYEKNQTWLGLDKLVVNNMYSDSSYMKEYFSYDIMEYIGVDVPLYAFADIKVNGETWGFYIAIECYEEGYVERVFDGEGELYKPESSGGMGGAMNVERAMPLGGDDAQSQQNQDIQNNQGIQNNQNSSNGEDVIIFFGDGQMAGDMPQMRMDGADMGGSVRSADGTNGAGGMDMNISAPLDRNNSVDFGQRFSPDSSSPNIQDSPNNPDNQNDQNSQGSPGGGQANVGANQSSPNNLRERSEVIGGNNRGNFAIGGMGGMGNSSGGIDLKYIDDKTESYSAIFNNGVFKNNLADYERVITALKNLNEGTELETYVDVDAVLRYFAAHTTVVNLDSYVSGMAHNYYLYENGGQIKILPWDYNMAFGGFQSGNASDIVNFPIDTPVSGVTLENRPLIGKLLEVPEYVEKYHSFLTEIIDGYFSNGKFEQKVEEIDKLISEYVKNDPSAFTTFEKYEEAVKAFKELGRLRALSIQGQLDGIVPSTTETQRSESDKLIDASSLNLSALGSMGGGRMVFRNDGGDEMSFESFGGGGMMFSSDQTNTDMFETFEIINSEENGVLSEEQRQQLYDME